ncbi:MAG: DUF3237 domain-containing protein [Novosphingobium sp.]
MFAPFRKALGLIAVLALAAANGPAAPAPALEYAFTATVTLAPPVEQGTIDGGRQRFIAITGGTVDGPLLHGSVLPGGGDWQTILPGGLTRIEARYFLKADDGTVIEVTNPGVRTASPAVIDRLAKGENVDPGAYYFRTAPTFKVAPGKHDWLNRHAFVARGVRRPDRVEIDVYKVL